MLGTNALLCMLASGVVAKYSYGSGDSKILDSDTVFGSDAMLEDITEVTTDEPNVTTQGPGDGLYDSTEVIGRYRPAR